MNELTIWREPRITLCARQQFIMVPHINWTPLSESGEALAEFAGRLCYLSFGEGELDGHKTVRGRTDTNEYFENVLRVRHGSLLEHAVWSFLIEGVSRTFSHELVRHRAGFGFSQVSQRFVDESSVGFVVPPLILQLREFNGAAYDSWKMSCEESLAGYSELIANIELDTYIGKIPIEKKRLREAARSVLPGCTETKLVVTGNARAWRNFIEQRGAPSADLEMIRAVEIIAEALKVEAPSIFQDVAFLPERGVEVLHHKV